MLTELKMLFSSLKLFSPKILSSGPVARSLMASENLEQITFIGLIHLVRYNKCIFGTLHSLKLRLIILYGLCHIHPCYHGSAVGWLFDIFDWFRHHSPSACDTVPFNWQAVWLLRRIWSELSSSCAAPSVLFLLNWWRLLEKVIFIKVYT